MTMKDPADPHWFVVVVFVFTSVSDLSTELPITVSLSAGKKRPQGSLFPFRKCI